MTVIVKSPRECPEVVSCWLFKSLVGDVRVVTTEADVERVLCLSNMLCLYTRCIRSDSRALCLCRSRGSCSEHFASDSTSRGDTYLTGCVGA